LLIGHVGCQSRIVKEGDPQAKVPHYCGEPVATLRRVIYRSSIPHGPHGRRIVVAGGGTRVDIGREELAVHRHSVVEVLVE